MVGGNVWFDQHYRGSGCSRSPGAYGRTFSGLSGVVFLPRLSRIADDSLYRLRYFQFGGLLLATSATLFVAAVIAPEVFLRLLGNNYRGLRSELLLVVASSALAVLGGYAVAVNMARSWIRWQTLAVLVLAAVQAILVWLLPLGTTAGVLRFNLGTAAAGLALQVVTTAAGFWRPEWVRWQT